MVSVNVSSQVNFFLSDSCNCKGHSKALNSFQEQHAAG